MIDVMF